MEIIFFFNKDEEELLKPLVIFNTYKANYHSSFELKNSFQIGEISLGQKYAIKIITWTNQTLL